MSNAASDGGGPAPPDAKPAPEPVAAPPAVSVPLPAATPPDAVPLPAAAPPDPKPDPRNGLDKMDTSHYIDPIERSLASLERSLKADVPMDVNVSVSDSSIRLEDDFALPKPQTIPDAAHQTLMAQLSGITEVARVPEQMKTDIYLPAHNGFVEKNASQDRDIIRPDINPNIPNLSNVTTVSSIFDPISSTPLPIISQSHHNMSSAPSPITPAVKKEDSKPLLTPKPIEDLMGVPLAMVNNLPDRAKYEIDKKMEDTKNSNFAQAFKLKQEQNLKNASSWSSLAQAGSPQSVPNMVTNNQIKQKPVMDSFQVRLT